MLIFIVKKYLFVSFECFVKLFFVSCITLSEKESIFALWRTKSTIYRNSIYVMSNLNLKSATYRV
jgi:hypothetical protein